MEHNYDITLDEFDSKVQDFTLESNLGNIFYAKNRLVFKNGKAITEKLQDSSFRIINKIKER